MAKYTEHKIKGVYTIEPTVFEDERGYFFEAFNEDEFDKNTGDSFFYVFQENQSYSKKGTFRGLHFQYPPRQQAKLVSVAKGSVIDFAVDIREGSETYGQMCYEILTEENKRKFFIPKGFAHGFVVISDDAIFQYNCDEYYHPEFEGGFFPLNNEFPEVVKGIHEVLKKYNIGDLIMSDKDVKRGTYKDDCLRMAKKINDTRNEVREILKNDAPEISDVFIVEHFMDNYEAYRGKPKDIAEGIMKDYDTTPTCFREDLA